MGLGPLALAHHWRDASVLADAVDVDLVRADHPVDVDHRFVAAALVHLFGCDRLAVDEAIRIALTERDVARGVFVEQRVVEQDTAALIGEECGTSATSPIRRPPSSESIALTSTSRPRLALTSTILPPSKRIWMSLDQRAIVAQRLGGGDDAVDALSRCGVVNTSSVGILGLHWIPFFATPLPPFQACPSARPSVRSVPGPEYLSAAKFLPVSQARALVEALVVRVPGRDRIGGVDARRREDRIRKLLDRHIVGLAGKHFLAQLVPGNGTIDQLISWLTILVSAGR